MTTELRSHFQEKSCKIIPYLHLLPLYLYLYNKIWETENYRETEITVSITIGKRFFMRAPLIRSSILLKDFSAIATASKTLKSDNLSLKLYSKWWINCLLTLPRVCKEAVCIACRNEIIFIIIIWLAQWGRMGMINEIQCCDCLPKRTTLGYLACMGLPAVSSKENFRKSQINK